MQFSRMRSSLVTRSCSSSSQWWCNHVGICQIWRTELSWHCLAIPRRGSPFSLLYPIKYVVFCNCTTRFEVLDVFFWVKECYFTTHNAPRLVQTAPSVFNWNHRRENRDKRSPGDRVVFFNPVDLRLKKSKYNLIGFGRSIGRIGKQQRRWF